MSPKQRKPHKHKECDRPHRLAGPRQPGKARRDGTDARIHEIQLVKGLRIVSILRHNPDVRIARCETIYEVGPDPPLMMILKDKTAVRTVAGQVGVEFKLNFAAPLLYLLHRGESDRGQKELQGLAVICK